MPNERVSRKQVISFLKDVDDTVKILTGRRIPSLVANGFELFGVHEKEVPPAPEFDINDPYFILGVRTEAHDIVIRGAFRSLAREFHPDTGTHPNPKAFQRVQEAYNEIMKARSSGA